MDLFKESQTDIDGIQYGDTDKDGRCQTFRKRRLTLSKLNNIQDAVCAIQENESWHDGEDQDSHFFKKSREDDHPFRSNCEKSISDLKSKEKDEPILAFDKIMKTGMTGNSQDEPIAVPTKSTITETSEENQNLKDESMQNQDNEEPVKRSNNVDESVALSSASAKPRIMHAGAPPVPNRKVCSISQLYSRNPAPHPDDSTYHHPPITSSNFCNPSEQEQNQGWKERKHYCHSCDETHLPFPRSVVGTYSCYGVEPIFDLEDEQGDNFDLSPNGKGNQHNLPKLSSTAKINQDRGGVVSPFASLHRTALFAVYDGHGEGGEMVSQFALHEIPRRIQAHTDFKAGVSCDSANGKEFEMIERVMVDVFNSVNDALLLEHEIEPTFAGSTACVVVITENGVIIANLGDSRAVLARKVPSSDKNRKTKLNPTSTDQLETIPLSVDQNPDSSGEKSRILVSGGFVSPPPEPGLSARVWLDEEMTKVGLAMSRSLGDYAVKTVGVISTPVVTFHKLQSNDDFLILATDGVWEFISSEEAVHLVHAHLVKGEGSSKACQSLIEAAAARWHEYEGDYRDDITAIVIQLKELW
eukprot:CAMPEP_0184869844 /NCGR_PEP_ID=MMETSP0580-20130426/35536_1 /TAXON_ID=1118495 /ORGANISM="Dactyliosolen fragilissimus" /LENGTH=583 /DNA_ID=CAMNT_0027371601 /DNA_START=104 /DNA_END=1855 /DNA_ORIENTATION=+